MSVWMAEMEVRGVRRAYLFAETIFSIFFENVLGDQVRCHASHDGQKCMDWWNGF